MKKLLFPSLALNFVFLLGLFLLYSYFPVYKNGLIRKKIVTHQERRIQQFSELPTTEGSYVFWGDTRLEEANWEELLQNPKVKNRGNSGETLKDFMQNMGHIVKAKPAKLFLLMGYQDLLEGKSPDEIYKSYGELIASLKKQLPKTVIYLHSLPPTAPDLHKSVTNNEQVLITNGKLKDLAQKYETYYIDLWSALVAENNSNALNVAKYSNDGYHLNAAAYTRWKGLIEQYTKND